MRRFRRLEIKECPFGNLPEKHAGRWRQGLTAEKDAGLPVAGAGAGGAVEFEEWTQDAHLRHSRFVGLREDRSAKEVRRE